MVSEKQLNFSIYTTQHQFHMIRFFRFFQFSNVHTYKMVVLFDGGWENYVKSTYELLRPRYIQDFHDLPDSSSTLASNSEQKCRRSWERPLLASHSIRFRHSASHVGLTGEFFQ